MNRKEFKKIFGNIAVENNFEKEFGGWFKQSPESVVTLDRQKSNFGNYFDLNLKVYIQGIFGHDYKISKELVKKDTGDIFMRQPKSFNLSLDLDSSVDENGRFSSLRLLFQEFVNPFAEKMLNQKGILQVVTSGEVFVLPAVKKAVLEWQ